MSIFSSPQHSGFTLFLSFPITSIYFSQYIFLLLLLNFKQRSLFVSISLSVCLFLLCNSSLFMPQKLIQANSLPISSSSEVMDLDRRAIAGVLSLLLCWGTGGEEKAAVISSAQLPPAFTYSSAPGCSRKTLTFLPRAFLHVGVAGYHDNLDHEAVATLPNHVDNLSVTNLHHILTVDLGQTSRQRGTKSLITCFLSF